MIRALALLLLLATVPAWAAPVPKELKRNDDARNILGTWQMVHHSMGGGPPTPQSVKWRLEPDGKATILNLNEIAVTYKLHPGTSPKGFDWNWPTSSYPGLYELDGDTLKVVILQQNGTARPTKLEPGPKVIYCEFKRLAPEGKK